MKYIGIKLSYHVHNLYTKNYKKKWNKSQET